jgi:hypothetical protein
VKLPHKILVILLLGVLSRIEASPLQSLLDQIESSATHSVAGGCSIKEPWGYSVYALDGLRGIHHYVWHNALLKPQSVRFIATDTGVTLCTLTDRALVFIDPAHGVYQIDRAIEGDGEQLWIAPIPLHFVQSSDRVSHEGSVFKVLENDLYLVTGAVRSQLMVETSVRNDDLPELHAALELDVGNVDTRLGRPVQTGPDTVLVSDGHQQFAIDLNTRNIQALPNVPASSDAITLGANYLTAALLAEHIVVRRQSKDGSVLRSLSLPLSSAADTTGLCLGGSTDLVSFGRGGKLYRYELALDEDSAEQTGQFQLTHEVVSCLIDQNLRRLYVVEQRVGIWVFDLRQTGLVMPRAVTTDKMVDSLLGVALYEQGEQGYVISQSVGNGAFLVFDRSTMVLRGQFSVVADIRRGIDGVRSSRGFSATANPLPGFPQGVLVVHDQRNRLPESGENLKLVDWREIVKMLNVNKVGGNDE